MSELAGKVAVVTGAAGSIGRAIAALFASRGASVVLGDLNMELARAVAGGMPKGQVIPVHCDVASASSTSEAVGAALGEFGRLDLLVNCAAADVPRRRAVELDPDDWRRAIEVNLTGSYLLCRAAIPPMVAQGGGAIILLASQLAHVAAAGQVAYCSSKGGILQLARTLAVEHAGDNIRVNTLSPGAIGSDRLRRHYGTDEAAAAALAPRHPLGRLGLPKEVAAAALFLASDASSFMTGADLLVDGGYTAI